MLFLLVILILIFIMTRLLPCNRYVSLLSDYGLLQYILQPTRVSLQSSTLIDHVICTNDISVLNSSQAVGLSDHRVQLVDFDVPTQ